jgi:hypothetical protein
MTVQATDREAGALYVPIRDTARSPYTETSDLLLWYWHPFPDEKLSESFHDLYKTWGIGWALGDLGVSTVGELIATWRLHWTDRGPVHRRLRGREEHYGQYRP